MRIAQKGGGRGGMMCPTLASWNIYMQECLVSGHTGDCKKSYKECMILMYLNKDTKKRNMQHSFAACKDHTELV